VNDRKPRVGDLLIQKVNGRKYIGLVCQLCEGSAFIKWGGDTPHGYYKKHGYSVTNIHNQHHVFSLVRP